MRISLLLLAACALVACGDDDNTPLGSGPDGGTGSSSSGGAVPDSGAAAGTWTPRASLPIPKQELAVVAIGERVFVFGGLDAMGRSLADVGVYDTKTDAWALVAPLPEPLHHVNAAAADGKIWVVGALSGGAFTATGVTHVYDPAANTWTPRAVMPAGTERGASFVAAIGTKIYVAGGLRGGASVADFSVYDTVVDAWTPLPALPVGRDHGMAAAVGDRFFAIGGRAAAINGHTTRVDVFDPASGVWSARAPMPTSRGGGAAAVAKGKIVVMSGEGNANASTGVFAETEAYDPATDTWTTLAPMRTPRHGTNAATVNDVVYVPGGGTVQALGASDVVESFSF